MEPPSDLIRRLVIWWPIRLTPGNRASGSDHWPASEQSDQGFSPGRAAFGMRAARWHRSHYHGTRRFKDNVPSHENRHQNLAIWYLEWQMPRSDRPDRTVVTVPVGD
jgi:hypothetical protein